MTQPGVVRQPGPRAGYEQAPVWIRTVLTSAVAYGDFITDMIVSIKRCDEAIVRYVESGDLTKATKMIGKKEALDELRFIVEAYRKEEEVKNVRERQGQ